jgi:hypothetical protein
MEFDKNRKTEKICVMEEANNLQKADTLIVSNPCVYENKEEKTNESNEEVLNGQKGGKPFSASVKLFQNQS